MLTVFLGVHQPNWLWDKEPLAARQIPCFVSYMRLRGRRQGLPPARVPYALDSGAFSVHDTFGGWEEAGITPRRFAADMDRLTGELGRAALRFVSPMDGMCEAAILKKSGRSIAQQQRITVDNYLRLVEIAPQLPWLPVLQGWDASDYLRCLELYREAGVGTQAGDYFGLGTVCRRQETPDAERVIARLGAEQVRLHLFGFKQQGLARVASLPHVESSDSLAWSYAGRHQGHPCPESLETRVSCANCLHYALDWYDDTLELVRQRASVPRNAAANRLSAVRQLGMSFA